MLIRARAWWYNKLPLSFAFVLLLSDGNRAGIGVWLALLFVVLAVCGAANYGYALNELFDTVEDARIGRVNAASSLGRTRVWSAAVLSLAWCLFFGWCAAGWTGFALACVEMCIPAAYSVPPLRVKERAWLGVCADALAAHVFPALLALAACAHFDVRNVPVPLVAASVLWAFAAGLRGILSHQLHTAADDDRGGLRTVVHSVGRARLERGVVAVLVPLEAAAFLAIVLQCSVGAFFWSVLAIYAAIECYKVFDPGFRVTALRPQGQRYVPMLQENLYKAWAPLALACDAARLDLRYLGIAIAYVVLFRVHLRAEAERLRLLADGVRSGRPWRRSAVPMNDSDLG